MELLSIESVRTDSLPNRRTTLRSGFAFTRIVILLSRIIKPDDSIPRDIVCRVNITKTLRGRRRAPCWLHLYTLCVEASDTSCELLGFHLAVRPDWTNRHCQRVTPGTPRGHVTHIRADLWA